MFKFLKSQLPLTEADQLLHLKAWSKMKSSETHKDVFEHLYECLSVLDDKSSALLGFNSIIMAVFALFITDDNSLTRDNSVKIILLFGIFFVMISSLLLLFVVWIHWSKTSDFQNLDKHGLHLLNVRNERTIKYRIAWCFSVISIAALSLYLLIHQFAPMLVVVAKNIVHYF